MADNRTGPAVQNLVESIQDDVAKSLDQIRRGLSGLRTLQGQTKGINGFSTTLKTKGDEIDLAAGVIEEEAKKVADKMLYEPRGIQAPKLIEKIDHEHTDAVLAAREEA